MSENTSIEWCDHTFNPWEGCQKVGPGCDHCYAEVRNARFAGGTAINWGPGAPRRRTSPANWNKPLAWDKAHAGFFAAHGRRQRVFCASLADVFDNAVDPQWRADLFEMIRATPNLDWLLLTKRIGNVEAMVEAAGGWPENAQLGSTIVNQPEADRDIPKLLATKSSIGIHVVFLSMEPLLGPVDLAAVDIDGEHEVLPLGAGWLDRLEPGQQEQPRIDWVIVGGESGTDARPMHPEWVFTLRDQCQKASVPFLFKQWGEWTPGVNVDANSGTVATAHWFDNKWFFGRENLASFGGHVDDEPDLYRIGKKAAGRLLDGVQHDGYPKVRP